MFIQFRIRTRIIIKNLPVTDPDTKKWFGSLQICIHHTAGNSFYYRLQGLTNYLDDLKFAAAQQDDLWKHLTDQAHR
jgi:hypothetical protein